MRALERAYLRMLIDPCFAAALSEAGVAQTAGLSLDECELLIGFAPDTLSVERSGRQSHLWGRARTELPQTLARVERRLPHETVALLRARVFTDLLWSPERTLDLPLFGKGYELATHIRDALRGLSHAAPEDEELELLANLAALERGVFALREGGSSFEADDIVLTVTARHDLMVAAERPGEPATTLRDAAPACWYLTGGGRVGRAPGGLEAQHP